MAGRAARANSTILIRAETGTGKELLARAIHFNSARKERPFLTINCGAIPKDLLELVEDVLLNRRPDATERLIKFADTVKKQDKAAVVEDEWRKGTVEDRLSHALVKGIVDYIDGDMVMFEHAPLENLARDGQLMAYRHEGFWAAMDTLRDKHNLQKLWDSGERPWAVWGK